MTHYETGCSNKNTWYLISTKIETEQEVKDTSDSSCPYGPK